MGFDLQFRLSKRYRINCLVFGAFEAVGAADEGFELARELANAIGVEIEKFVALAAGVGKLCDRGERGVVFCLGGVDEGAKLGGGEAGLVDLGVFGLRFESISSYIVEILAAALVCAAEMPFSVSSRTGLPPASVAGFAAPPALPPRSLRT